MTWDNHFACYLPADSAPWQLGNRYVANILHFDNVGKNTKVVTETQKKSERVYYYASICSLGRRKTYNSTIE